MSSANLEPATRKPIIMTTLLVTAAPAQGESEGEARGRYLQAVGPLLVGAGGTLVKRARVTDTIAGTAGIAVVLVMDFESAEAIQGVFASDAYKALIPDRDTGFSNIEILITEPLD
jgi:uncharacterized protein (DUF1330 family)